MKFAKIFFMMMLCLVILLKVSSAQVERSSEMTGDYFSGDSFEFRDDMYIVKVNSYDQVILEYSGKYLVIKNNSCSRKDIYFDFCVESIEYDYDEKDKKASIEIFSSLPEIEVERDISDPEVMVGETTRITDTITNTGQRKAYNVTFLDTYPLSINISIPIKYRNTVEIRRDQKIKLANGSTVKAYTVFWQDNLDIGESMTFAYDLTALQPLDEDFYSKIIYFNGYENIDENSESISLKAEPYFDLRVNLVDVSYKNQPGVTDIDNWERKSSIYSGNDILLIADIVNIYGDNNTLDVPKLRFFFPSGVRYLGTTTMRIFGNSSDSKSSYIRVSPELTRIDDHYYTWSGTTRKDGQLFVIKLKAAEEGDHVIRVSGDFNKSGLPMIYDYSKLVDLEVKKDELVIGTSVEDGEEFSSGQLVYFSVYITNPNDNVNFTDVKVQVNSSLTGEKTFLINKLYATKYVDVINQYINMPTVTQTESILLKINVTYKTQFGEELNKVEQMSLRVNPLAPFRIIHKTEGVSVTDSGSLTVNHKESDMSLSISNELEKDIEGIVVTEYTGGISKESKISSKIFLLPKNIKTMIYQYKIDPPDLTTESNYTIRTYIQYIFEGQSYNASTEVLVKVKPKEMDIDVSKDVLEDNPSKGQIVHVNYEIENTEKEPIYDVILLFPRQYSTDLVGMTNYTIDQIRPGERISITNQERVRIKTDDSVKLEPTKIIFKDSLGNVFSDETTSRSLDIEDGYLATPALLINISAPIKAIQGEDFNAKIMISNVGKEATTATLQYGGRTEKVSVMPESYNIMNLTYNLEGQGLVEIPRVFTSYDVEGFTYHTASDITEIYLAEKVEKKPVVIEEIVEPVPEEKKKIFNIKYLYLLGFIILVSLIILYIIKRPNKDEGFEFIEK